MAQPSRTWAVAATALALTTAAVVWWLGGPAWLGAGGEHHPPVGAAAAPAGSQTQPLLAQVTDSSFFARRRALGTDGTSDPLLVNGLRDTLEALLMEAGDASDPATLKQRLAALVGRHFPAALATRALALAERYVDYRVALGSLRAPQDLTDPRALRDALEARHKVRLQFFDDAEYDALFAREADLDRYTLARLEIARNPQLSPEQRAQALQAADNELSTERRAERSAATEHMAAAAQTAAFNAGNADERTRYAARSVQYGQAAAQAMAQLDRDEQHWNQRLDQYHQARAQQGEGAALQQLRQQLFSPEEQQRIDAALALRQLNASTSGS
ncbi:lipase secretion chaperone [Acidovorax sp. D2M1]|uniref:Lipase helper protein n=1 Tax=Acidovorax benzenivorans TaxID=2987520 RepID=A0ABT5RSS2_9BURK|nr:lipase secretion chaperone [Acidovorax benzenivorans]MDD2176739.1 lipase secretion chaperone [Acidovorax benzenivorans]